MPVRLPVRGLGNASVAAPGDAGSATTAGNLVTRRRGNGGPNLTAIPSAKRRSVVLGQVTNGGGGIAK